MAVAVAIRHHYHHTALGSTLVAAGAAFFGVVLGWLAAKRRPRAWLLSPRSAAGETPYAYEDFVACMPKVELHVHLDGAWDPAPLVATAKTLQAAGTLALPDHVDVLGQRLPVAAAVAACGSGAQGGGSSGGDKGGDEGWWLSDFRALTTCRGKGSLPKMLSAFETFLPLARGRLALLEELALRFVGQQAAHGVLYTEVRYSPHLLATADCGGGKSGKSGGDESGGDKEGGAREVDDKEGGGGVGAAAVLAAVTRGLRRGEAAYGVSVNQILCVLAFPPYCAPEVALATVRLAHAHREDAPCAVVGVDVAAGEEWFIEEEKEVAGRGGAGRGGGSDLDGKRRRRKPQPPITAALALARRLGLPITLHAGEGADSGNVRRAVFAHGARRIGHGYRAADDPPLLRALVARGVHFECCPTSSYATGGWDGGNDGGNGGGNGGSNGGGNGGGWDGGGNGGGPQPPPPPPVWRNHPLRRLIEAGASVSLNSDDPSVFATSLTEELRLAASRPPPPPSRGRGSSCDGGSEGGVNGGGGIGLTRAQLVHATLCAVDAAFLPPPAKARLRIAVLARFAALS